jgi:glycosyltransferase involved in cell wall biosynthesis
MSLVLRARMVRAGAGAGEWDRQLSNSMQLNNFLSRLRNGAPPKPHEASSLMASGDAARDAHEWAAAAGYYREVLKKEPDAAHVWVQYGHALKESKDLQGAEVAYRKALAIEPAVADTYLNLGHALKLATRTQDAADAYLKALALDQSCADALHELSALGWTRGEIRSRLASRGLDTQPDVASGRHPHIVLDVSDLMQYFKAARLPTGIQRVQMAIINALLDDPMEDVVISIAGFAEDVDGWVTIPPALFRRTAALAVSGGNLDAPEWRSMLRELRTIMSIGAPHPFPQGTFLVNLGTSWWLQNYFLQVRDLKDRCGVRYYPLVYDVIPVIAPEHCIKELTQDFISWLLGAFDHAEGFFAISRCTAADLGRVAGFLGHAVPEPVVVPLDARPDGMKRAGDAGQNISARRGRPARERYVLFVSTIESRKNHLLAFSTWLSMLESRGPARTPKLICVGNHGWLVDAALARLKSSELLRQKVELISRISDTELSELYQHCLFTILPSVYEGWGLPVTESLCHGKVPLVASSSSLPEAGGELADYFDVRSERNFQEKLERLIDDVPYREARERRIREEFVPRSWRQIAEQMVNHLLARHHTGQEASDRCATGFPVELARHYSLARNRETVIWPRMRTGEIYRTGTGWWAPDDFGSWVKPGGAELSMRMPDGIDVTCILYLFLHGPPAEATKPASTTIDIAEGPLWTGDVAAGAHRTVKIVLNENFVRKGAMRMRISSEAAFDLRRITNGRDEHVVSVGLAGFFLCREDDLLGRLSLMECLQMGDMRPLNGSPGQSLAGIHASAS